MKFQVLIIAVLIFGCSHKPVKKSYPLVDNFVKAWAADYGPYPIETQKSFRQYLTHMEDFYDGHNLQSKFPNYLSSLRNTHQLLAHAEMNLPSKFKRHYGHWPVQKSSNYLKYQTEQTAELKNKLETTRLNRIKEEIGTENYDKLLIHASGFDKKGQDFKIIL